jgi:hypothetical protein
MDSFKERPSIKNCPVCRLAMVGDKSDSRLTEFDIYRCLACDLTISTAPTPAGDDEE